MKRDGSTGPGSSAGAAAGLPFELPDELRLDPGLVRRVITGFIQGQLRQAGFERLVLGLSEIGRAHV